jgi:hypothetical protein
MKTTYLSNNTIATKSSRPMRQLCGLAIAALAAIGLSAPLASAVTVPVINGNFETEFGTNTDPALNWAKIPSAPWSFENGNTGLKPIAGNFSSDPDGGSNFTRFTWNNAGVEQNLQTTVSAGDTLSVTFNLGVSSGAWDLDRSRVRGNAYFKVDSTYYKMPYDLSLPATPATGVWYPFTFTTTITNSGNLSIGFQNLNATNTYYTSLDGVSDVTWTTGTFVNTPPTSSGGSVVAGIDTARAFAAGDFQFSDADNIGQTLQAIMVTSLPSHGTLMNGLVTVTSADLPLTVPLTDIPTLTYTPTTSFHGDDSFNFKVSDGLDYSVANATMAISVQNIIFVQNGSLETRGGINNATYWWSLGSPWVGGISPQGYEVLQVNQFNTMTAAANGLYAANLETWLVSVTQNLNTTVNTGSTLSMTFSGGRARGQAGGKFTVTFKVGTTEYTSSEIDTTLQLNDTWQSYTFATPISNTGNLSIIFRPVSGRPWLDNISNVSVSGGGGGGFANWAPAGGQAPGEDYNNDGVQNGIAYFMNATGQATLPGLIDNTVTWTNGGNIPSTDYGTQFAVETSPDLENWTPVDVNDPNLSNTAGTVSYTLTPGLDKQFARLAVTPN